ncbi:hypothetical protein EAH57_15580 [Acinetobacter sp. 2JN-4]|uniref:hypothetical protein n=1 Tax=Acinetobacter sp. 2JN-4 TaxID=2479844 RepID=UPI000EF9CA09|nr:hypothetical protein [Acinetobacter sp. 2JN-4]RLZ06657.1 hypothetical protein EAH57_15580 [Acinetobacter sp. 2JN-4]
MPVITVKEKFKIAIDNGNQVVEFVPGEFMVDDRVAHVSIHQLKVAVLKKGGSKNANFDTGTGEAAAQN